MGRPVAANNTRKKREAAPSDSLGSLSLSLGCQGTSASCVDEVSSKRSRHWGSFRTDGAPPTRPLQSESRPAPASVPAALAPELNVAEALAAEVAAAAAVAAAGATVTTTTAGHLTQFPLLLQRQPCIDTTFGHSRRPQTASPSPMERLPLPQLVQVLQRLQPTAWDLCRLSCVSRAWRTACANKAFWTRLRIGSGSLKPGVEQLAPRCVELEELFIDDPHLELHVLHPLVMACARSLRKVVINCNHSAREGRDEGSVNGILWLISLYCKDVDSIELLSNGQDAWTANLEGRTMWFLTSAFRNLHSFASLARGSVTKQCVFLMAIAWRQLTCLRLHMQGLLTEDLLTLRKCLSLQVLELTGGRLNHIVPRQLHHCQAPAYTVQCASAANRQHYSEDTCAVVAENNPGGDLPAVTGQDLRARWPQLHLSGVPDAQTSQSRVSTAITAHGLGLGYNPDLVFHPTLELLVLNRVEFETETAVLLALACPNLKKILVSGPLCASCVEAQGTCRSLDPACVRRKVDLVQQMLARIKMSIQQ